ncbi:hypothetical protein M758_12G011700 [Ceratodon purpureus]|uniref:Uncharacterized protein n=1 Tax=Ceratodon purpureus TaxID=3225 RepID=A0A8T0G5R8_CERPU|nr:hypothetical protein KC19_12G010900 [Ceratodon purpureus]KAG0597654.1 hypothetical protein M758_12G011700 [Ceratodon purpureus]
MYNIGEDNLIKPPCYVTSHPRSNLESVPRRSGYFEKACLTYSICGISQGKIFPLKIRLLKSRGISLQTFATN